MSTTSPPPSELPPPRRSRVGLTKAIVGVLGTAGLLGWLLARVDLAAVAAVFRRVEPKWLAVGMVLYVLLQCVRALRYRGLAPEASARVLVGVHFVHALLLRVMPFRTGELGFAWLMRRHDAGGFTRNLVGVLLLRVLDLTTVLVVFAVGLVAFGAGAETGRPSWVIVAAAAVAALAPLYVRGLVRLAHRILAAILRAVGLTRLERVREAEASLAEAVRWSSQLSRPLLFWLSGLTTAQWAVNFALFGVLMAAMGVEVGVAQTVVGGTGSVLGGLLPLAGVGNFGPLEAGWSVGFRAAGLEEDLAIATAFGFSVISFGYATLTGLLGWLALPRPAERD